MTFAERVYAVHALLHAGNHTISVNANPGIPDAAYGGITPTVGTAVVGSDGSMSIMTDDMCVVRGSPNRELPDAFIQWLNGRRVAAWVLRGRIQTIGAVGYPGKPVMMTPEMLERFQRRNPRANRYRPLN